jgi:hypothetical protein
MMQHPVIIPKEVHALMLSSKLTVLRSFGARSMSFGDSTRTMPKNHNIPPQ